MGFLIIIFNSTIIETVMDIKTNCSKFLTVVEIVCSPQTKLGKTTEEDRVLSIKGSSTNWPFCKDSNIQ